MIGGMINFYFLEKNFLILVQFMDFLILIVIIIMKIQKNIKNFTIKIIQADILLKIY